MGYYDHAGGHEPRWNRQALSYRVGTLFDIKIRVHLFFVVFVVLELINSVLKAQPGRTGEAFLMQLVIFVILFVLVLLHEFGHCFGCRSVGGEANDVLLWPLGGLAYTNPPNRPGDHLVTTLAGPGVNLVVCLLLIPILAMQSDLFNASLFNPLNFPYRPLGLEFLTLYTFKISYIMLLFNMLPVYPLDGGRVLQEVLWFKQGFHDATRIATIVGMFGGGAMAIFGIYLAGWQGNLFFLLAVVGVFCALECYRTKRELEITGTISDNEFGYDFSQGYTSLERSMGTKKQKKKGKSFFGRLAEWRRKRQMKSEEQLESEVDRILAKIQEKGMGSLTRAEKRILEAASKKRRQ